MGGSLLSALAVALSNASLPACGIWVAGWRPLSRQVWGERSVALAPRHGRSGCWGPVPAPLDAAPPAVAPPAFPVCYEDYEDPTRKVKKSQEGLLSGCGAHNGRSFQRELKVLKVLGLRSRT